MYRHETKIRCDICQAEFQYLPSGCYAALTLDSRCEDNGWLSIGRPDCPVEHVCPECIRIVGYAHSFGLAEAVLKKFDPQTYSYM